ncbi:DNA-binding CsgD family transcriptional regulator/catechol 2,3-dioxygenase-like lactoylglutathione lyase family enzyme [Kribbella aluminosa]|uniref:DNA-binding CsgD family transcriptional regulator/catechol 2,3-dioxygenase-like lactoylglutathione lyase family enzyme n=1 Tax=Kribbella aluminosa TaxID=416017 RepID=A0ABS4UFI9_9ACTN|nr:VOC family protein [Kribbella aluminosa]MBP2350401.1 DNA-binding CsgD family transcriptional regulator/catechol 2,3-dioxygenase-like lactoylglutathione lyase family enzyme [Kribbella aluminosa]
MGTRGRPRHPDVLTPAEWQVVHAVRHGMSNQEIARRRGVSVDAVKFHVANALMKLGLTRRTELRGWRGVPADSPLRAQGAQPMELGVIGQIARPVRDIHVAVDFYGTVLGLPHLYTFGDLAFFDCGGTRLFLSATEEPAQPSILYFRVDDIQTAYDELRARGVEFEQAPHLIHKHDNGVEEWMAFFPDPDGHLLAIMAQAVPTT